MTRARLDALLASAWLLAGLTAGLALVLALVVNRVWLTDLSLPLAYSNDALQYLMYSKSIHDHGWILENGRLGAPFGLLMYDWAEGGWPSLIGVRLLDALTGNWLLAHNLFYLLGYPLAALAALWGLRHLGVAPLLAVALAVLYAVLPYHQDRQTAHYMLSLYYGLPPILAYAATTAAGRPALPLRRGNRTTRQWLLRALPPLAAAGLAGLMQSYYLFFLGILVVAGGLFGWLRTRRPAVIGSTLVLSLVLGGALLLQYSPSLAYRLANGTNYDVGNRYHGETELYPLKLADLLLPVPRHPIAAFAELRERYAEFPSRGQQGLALGIAGSAGLLLALGGLVVLAASRRPAPRLAARLGPLGWLALVGLGVGMLGGGSTILGFIVGPYLRAWDRIAICIAFLAFAALGVTLTVLRRRFRRAWRAPLLAGLALVLVAGGTFDQAATQAWLRPYATFASQWRDDARFVAELEAQLPDGAMVYELPFIPFPENSRGEIVVNELLKPYLHSSTLRWSAGYMKGRDAGWQVIQSRGSAAQIVTLARALGFSGLTLQARGYPAGPETPLTAEAMAQALSAELGPPTSATIDSVLRFWPLGSAPPDPQMAADARDPVWMYWGGDFDVMYLVDAHVTHRARAGSAVQLTSRRATPREVIIGFALRPDPDAAPRPIEVVWPDGSVETVTMPATGSAVVSRRLLLPAGRSELGFRVPGQSPRGYAFVLVDLSVLDISLAELAITPGP